MTIQRIFQNFLILFLFTIPAFAQSSVKVGIQGGLSIFKYSVRKIGAWDNSLPFRTGFTGGGSLEIDPLHFVAIETGLNYSMRGGYDESVLQNYPLPGLTYKTEKRFYFNYLSIPIHLQIKHSLFNLIVPYALGGINTGIFISGKSKITETGLDAPAAHEESINNFFNVLDFGYDLGAGLEFILWKYIPYLEFVYYKGLINISKEIHHWDNSEYGMCKNKGMEIKFGIKYRIK